MAASPLVSAGCEGGSHNSDTRGRQYTDALGVSQDLHLWHHVDILFLPSKAGRALRDHVAGPEQALRAGCFFRLGIVAP